MKNRRILVTVAVLLSLFSAAVANETLVSSAAAQNAPGYRVDTSNENGLYSAIFTTPHGSIKVNFPDDLAAGDTVSGSIYTTPTGKNEAERNQNLAELNSYVIDAEGQSTRVGDQTFSRRIDRALTIVLLYRGQNVATTTLAVSPSPPPSPTEFTIPTGGQQGRFIKIPGPSNGVFSSQDYVKIGGRTLPPLAESPRSLVVYNVNELLGPTTIDLSENGVTTQCPFRNIGIKLSAPKLSLIRGDTTTLQVTVFGLAGLAGTQSLELQNNSPGVITMSGGELQHLTIPANEVRPDGSYSVSRTLTGIMAGAFGVTGTVRWTEVCHQPAIGGTRPVDNSSANASARAKLEEGHNLLARFKFYAALDPLAQALKSYNSLGNQNGIGVTSDALGELYVEEGQYETALRYFQGARKAFLANRETLNASLVLSKIGEVNLLLDNNVAAKAAFAQFPTPASNPSATTDSDRHKAFFAYSRNKLGEGRADYLLGQLDNAERDFKDLMAAASSSQNANYQEAVRFRVVAATNLGEVLFKKGDLANARARYDEAAQFARRDRRADLEWAAKAGLGRTLWALSRRSQATLRQMRQDRRAAHASRQIQDRTQLQREAIDAYREALAGIETIVEGSLRAHEARTSFLSTTSQVFAEASAVNAEMALAGKGSGDVAQFTAEGFRIAEAGRARSLLDVLADGHAEIAAGVPPELVKRRSENLAKQQLLGAQLTGVSITGETPKQPVSELEAELVKLANEFESIESQIKTSSPRYTSLVHTRSLTLSEVQRQVLDDDTALLEYSLGAESSYLWVVTRQGASIFKLPAGSAMNQLAMDLRAQLIPTQLQRRNVGIDVQASDEQRGLGISKEPPTDNAAAFSRASLALYKVAVAPAASLVGNRRLVVVADGALNFVPFEALITTERGGDYSSLDYLFKTNTVSYAPSASVTAAMREQKRAAGRDVLLIADPIFSAGDARLQAGGSAGKPLESTRGLGFDSAVNDVTGQANDLLKLSRLAGTRTEAEQIARLAKTAGAQADLWLDLGANEDAVKTRDIQSYRALHIATHGILDAARPQFSGLVLSLVGNKNDDDGFLRTSEVFNLQLGAPLVVLSACESGLGKVKNGEGVIGLTRAFMYAGAPTVGVTLWSVADKPTAALMTDFYQHLLAPNTSPASAMREAQLAMIAGKKFSAPYYWAPFVLVGEWK